jgi:potassium channel subfamily K, other eukaryote
MNKYVPPVRPQQTYSQGFWHAVMAAVLYLISSMMLMVNMWGYFLGHYPQHFELTDEQRTLILQTMMFFIWLAGGAGIFAKVSGWQYVDALYFCDVTILTVGFGDLHPINETGMGLVFPYSVIGIIILGLIVGSIRQFARDLGHDKIVKTHAERRRVQTIQRSITSSEGVEQHGSPTKVSNIDRRPTVSTSLELKNRALSFEVEKVEDRRRQHGRVRRSKTMLALKRVASRKTKSLILREERDRFNAMRHIQRRTKVFKEYFALTMSIGACEDPRFISRPTTSSLQSIGGS